MSWIFGCIGHPPQHIWKKLSTAHEKSILNIQRDNLYIAAGGNSQTLFYSDKQDPEGWVICGTGLDSENQKIFRQHDWKQYIKSLQSDHFIDGHYVILQWDPQKIIAKTDLLGLRDIYVYHAGQYSLFSTRTDFLARLQPLELDMESFGSKWLSVTPLTTKSIFKNCYRICTGQAVHLTNQDIYIHNNRWEPSLSHPNTNHKETVSALTDHFQKLITLPVLSGRKLSVSFSAGFDSRFLLACLQHSKLSNWNIHSFGPDDLPDNKISQKITQKLNIEHLRYNQIIPSVSESWAMIQKYASQSLLTDSVTAILQLRYFENFRNQDIILIDGWGGEYWRREFFTKLFYLGQKAILSKKGKLLSQYLHMIRANIFKQNICSSLEQGEIQSAQILLDELPDSSKIGIANWLDLFAIRTKLPNAMGPEQARIDGICQNYMPLSQYSLLQNLFQVPVKYRKNGRLCREIIQQIAPELTKFPLVKNVTTKPFNMTSLQFRFYEKLHHKLSSPFIYEDKFQFFMQLKEPVMDTFFSKDTQAFDWYNLDSINNALEGFYQGDRRYFNDVDWWITFELFRQAHKI